MEKWIGPNGWPVLFWAGVVFIIFLWMNGNLRTIHAHVVALFDRYFITSNNSAGGGAELSDEDEQKADGSPAKRNGETGEKGIATGKSAGNDPFQFPDLFTGLARLVDAKVIGETDAIKIAVKASPGKSARYIEARAQLQRALMELRNEGAPQFRELDEEHRPALPVRTTPRKAA